jgi:hypothetical protein
MIIFNIIIIIIILFTKRERHLKTSRSDN